MVGTLKDVMDSMESGVFNFCQDGKCIGCGQCCSALLPVSEKELKVIHRYIEKKRIQPVHHIGNCLLRKPSIDLTCPFLDTSKEKDKCLIYQVRPRICREFRCDQPPSRIHANKEMFWRTRSGVNMWEEFGQ